MLKIGPSVQIVDSDLTAADNDDSNINIYEFSQIFCSTIGKNTVVGTYSRLDTCTLAGENYINRRCMLSHVDFGAYSYMGYNNIVRYCSIGKFCSLAWNISIGGDNHPIHHGSTFPGHRWNTVLGEERPVLAHEAPAGKIGNDVWVGSGATVLYGVNIGDGAVVAAGALVNRNVPPYAVVAGVPAKVIKMRFAPEIIQGLSRCHWWDLPVDGLKKARPILESEMSAQSLEDLCNICREYGLLRE